MTTTLTLVAPYENFVFIGGICLWTYNRQCRVNRHGVRQSAGGTQREGHYRYGESF